MKAKIVDEPITLKAGQLWRKDDQLYLAVRKNTHITLINTDGFSSAWVTDGGFDGDDRLFTYVGRLEIEP